MRATDEREQHMLKSLSGKDQLLTDDIITVVDTSTLMNRMTALLLHAKEQNARFKMMLSDVQRA
jgi:hypothetical protein